MLSENTNHLLSDSRVQSELLKKRVTIAQHPRVRAIKSALSELPAEAVSDADFRNIVDRAPVLEKIVRAVNRPALLIKADSFEVPLADMWNAKLNAARASIEHAIRSVGRIELREPAINGHIGTVG